MTYAGIPLVGGDGFRFATQPPESHGEDRGLSRKERNRCFIEASLPDKDGYASESDFWVVDEWGQVTVHKEVVDEDVDQ